MKNIRSILKIINIPRMVKKSYKKFICLSFISRSQKTNLHTCKNISTKTEVESNYRNSRKTIILNERLFILSVSVPMMKFHFSGEIVILIYEQLTDDERDAWRWEVILLPNTEYEGLVTNLIFFGSSTCRSLKFSCQDMALLEKPVVNELKNEC